MKHERELVVRPWLPCPELEQRETEENDGWNRRHFRRMRAELAEFGDGDVLGVTVYDRDGNPEGRYWTSETQHGMQVFRKTNWDWRQQREPGRMYSGMLDSDLRIITSYGGTSLYGYKNEEQLVLEFADAERDFDEALCRMQKNQRELSRERTKSKKRDRLRERFAGIGKPPKAFEEWCREDLLGEHKYLFFDEAGRAETTALCSHCGKTVIVRRPYSELSKGVCPACGSKCVYRSRKRMNRKYGESARTAAAIFQRHGDEVLVRTFLVILEFRGGLVGKGEPVGRLTTAEDRRAFLDPGTGEVKAMYHKTGYGITADGFGETHVMNAVNAAVWPEGLREVRQGTALRYMPLEDLAATGRKMDVEQLWENAVKRPPAEYLIKMKLWKLAWWMLNAYSDNDIKRVFNMESRTPAELLRLAKADVKTVVEASVGVNGLEFMRMRRKCGGRVTAEQLREVDEMDLGWDGAARLDRMADYCGLTRTINYIKKQDMTPARALGLWTDYFDMANKLHIDLSDGMRLLPKDLKTAHDEAVKAVKVIENAETDKAIAVTAKQLEKWSWSRNGLLIRPARSYGELMTEGAALCHCVGRAGYAEKMARGETAIFFIRKEDEPETPLATLEIGLKSRKTIQCYGKNDRFPGEDVKRFYLQWEKQVVNGVPCQKKKTERRSA